MIRYEEIEPYLVDFLQGNADEATEYRIKAYVQQNPEFQAELDELNDTLSLVKKLPQPSPDASLKMNFYQKLAEAQQKGQQKTKLSVSRFTPQNWWNRAVASAAVVAIIFMTGYWTAQQINQQAVQEVSQEQTPQQVPLSDNTSSENEETASNNTEEATVAKQETTGQNKKEAIAAAKPTKSTDTTPLKLESSPAFNSPVRGELEIADEKAPLSEEETDIYADLVQQEPPVLANNAPAPDIANASILREEATNTDERLQEVINLNASDQTQTAAYLIERLQQDQSPNVRLMAAERLEQFLEQTEVQNTLLEVLNKTDLPVLQMTILDIVVKNRLKKGSDHIKQLLKQTQLEPLLRYQAEQALKAIS